MNIQIKPYENFDEAEIVELYSSVGWTVYAAAPDMLKRAYAGSMCVLGAYDGEKLVGIVRAVGDGASIMFIQDLLILPRYQRTRIRFEPESHELPKAQDVLQRLARFSA